VGTAGSGERKCPAGFMAELVGVWWGDKC